MFTRVHYIVQFLFLILVIVTNTSIASAADEFWQSPLGYASVDSTDEEVGRSFALTNTNGFSLSETNSEQSALSLTQKIDDASSLTFAYAKGQEQRNFMFGYTRNNLSVSLINGSGENYSELGGAYSGVDPYLFHGGFNQQFDYNGYAVDYAAGKVGHLQFGQATVKADGLLDRKAQYMEWSNNRLFARATQFARGSESVGNGFDAGFAFGNNKQLAFQSMQLDNGSSMERIRFQFNGKKTNQYWLDLSSHRNPLYQDNDDYRVMFSFKTLLGANSLVSYAAEPTVEEGGPTPKKKNRGLQRAVFIGIGVAAGAALSSSGSSSQDDSIRFRSERDAAFDVLNGINPTSVRENREHGGWVFINPDGSYSSTIPVQGEAASVRLPNPALSIPQGSRETATYHTHAAFDPRFDNENFSPTDLQLDRDLNLNGYLATPGGQFKFHNVATDQVSTLGSIATQ